MMSSSKSFEDWSEDMEIEASRFEQKNQQNKVFKKFLAKTDGTQE